MTEVHLTYFKDSGKYYSEGHYNTDKEAFYEIVEEIRQMLANGIRPGLVNGFEFHVLAEIFIRNGPLPHLFIRRPNDD